MYQLTQSLMAALLPEICPLCKQLKQQHAESICHACWHELHLSRQVEGFTVNLASETTVWLSYDSEVVKACMHAIKFNHLEQLAFTLGRCFAHNVNKPAVDALVPVPLSWRRQYFRGFNQAEAIARGASSVGDLPVKHLIHRPKHGKAQAKLAMTHRLQSSLDRYQCPEAVDGQRLLVMDDTATSGSTLNACAHTLWTSGASWVSVAALAHGA